MPQARIKIAPHMKEEILFKHYRRCKNAKERSYWQTIWLLSRTDHSFSVREVSTIVGFSPDWVRKLVRRYNVLGPRGFEGLHASNSGNQPLLTSDQQNQLSEVLQAPPEGSGLWSGPKVSQWIEGITGTRPSAVTGWNYLRRLRNRSR